MPIWFCICLLISFPLLAETDSVDGLEEVLADYELRLVQLMQSPDILIPIDASNLKHASLNPQDFLQKDMHLRAEATSLGWIEGLMANPCAETLMAFQEMNPEFVEIFVTDRFGMNVCQTNVTTDYFQADEKWWADTFDHGRGRLSHGAVEYDESAFSEVISIYLPIWNAEKTQVVGVAKAVADIIYIKAELE